MNGKAAAKLKIGDRVRYTGEDSCPGTITEANWMAVKITYDDGVVQILHHDDAEDIERLDERYDVTKSVA